MPISADAVSQESISWLAAALLGGLIGSRLGAGFLRTLTLRRLLAAVLVVAAAKLFFV